MKKYSEIATLLEQELDQTLVLKHPYSGFDYLEGHTVISAANKIFGFDGWDINVEFSLMKFVTLPASQKGTKRGIVSVPVKVSVRFLDDQGAPVKTSKMDIGSCPWAGEEQLETAMKGAVTDGLKRALRYYGKQFGNDLYKKDDTPASMPPSAPNNAMPPRGAATPLINYGATSNQKSPTCNKCGSQMKMRNGKMGPFWGCGNYPNCRNIYNIDEVDANGQRIGQNNNQPAPAPATPEEIKNSLPTAAEIGQNTPPANEPYQDNDIRIPEWTPADEAPENETPPPF